MEEKPSFMGKLLGKEPSEIPCFRVTFLSGIGGGMAVGFLNFMATSSVKKSTNRGFISYICVSLGTWAYCRYVTASKAFSEKQLQEALRQRALTDRIELELQLDKDAKEV